MKRQKQTQLNSCNRGVYPVRTHGFGVWNNPRVTTSFRMDKKLGKAFKRFLIAKFGSTCRGIEAIAVAMLTTEKVQTNLGVYPLTTNNITNIHFDPIRIERNVRTRRKLVVEEETETVMKEVRRRKEDVDLERVFDGVLDQWESLKASAKRYHLEKAREYSYLKSAQLLLSLMEH